MKKVTQDELMDWVDGTLSDSRRAQVDAHLAHHAEDAQLVADMQEALGMLHEWNAAETVSVSDNFWPQLRDQLPSKPGSGWHGQVSRVGSWLMPRREWKVRAGVAAFAVCAAFAILFFAPKNATHTVQAQTHALSPDEQQFIRQSLVQHRTYAAVQPFNAAPVTQSDGRNQDGDGDDSGNGSEYIPQ